jgi:Mg-chelatase subunit ChlD
MSIPESFLCPILDDLMIDPVIDYEGNSYERIAINQWLQNNQTSPLTRNLLKPDQLAPNRALKEAISQWKSANPQYKIQPKPKSDGLAENSAAAEDEKSPQSNQSQLHASMQIIDGVGYLKISPPEELNETNEVVAQRTASDICCCVDISGSMNINVNLKDTSGQAEESFLTQLDLVKHSLNTIIHGLSENDRLAIVSFATDAKTELNLTKMDKSGKETALAAVQRLEADGQTNLWAGLRSGLELLSCNSGENGLNNAAIYLLTDGEPNIEPPRGHIPTLERYKQQKNFQCAINTVGFGYKIQSNLLEQLSSIAPGSYSFIPDAGFVGTIFVNAISQLLCNVANNLNLEITWQNSETPLIQAGHGQTQGKNSVQMPLGSVQYGQTRDIVVKFAEMPTEAHNVQWKLRYNSPITHKPYEIGGSSQFSAANADSLTQFYRHAAVVAMKEAVNQWKGGKSKEIIAEIADKIAKYLQTEGNKGLLVDLLTDLRGEATLSVEKPQSFTRWGENYLRSFSLAHHYQLCNNFKDISVQNYGNGKLFGSLRDELDDIFNTLPAPQPGGLAQYGGASQHNYAAVDMAAYNNRYSGCFHGNSLVLVGEKGESKLASEILPGDYVINTETNALVRVSYTTKYKCEQNSLLMAELAHNLLITPYHPVFCPASNCWRFPIDACKASLRAVATDYVYNYVLEKGGSISLNGHRVITLAHGIDSDATARHAYYGSQQIVRDLKELDNLQANNGVVEYDYHYVVRDAASGQVIGIKAPAH